jgi:adenylosuccinate synthase
MIPKTSVIIEGTQGYGLGLHAGEYPYCTSSDTRAIDFLAMAGISPWYRYITLLDIWVVTRTFPIRVAGNSGPLTNETTWQHLADITDGYIQPERTTVTKKIRRVGFFDVELVEQALRANGWTPTSEDVHLALTFADYIDPTAAGVTDPDTIRTNHHMLVDWMVDELPTMPHLITTGPDTAVWNDGFAI